MIFRRLLSLVFIAALVFLSWSPAQAQLGDEDFSVFTVQNIDDVNDASVTIIFVNEAGDQFEPPLLLDEAGVANDVPNPFSLDPGKSKQINVKAVPGLPSGRYSVIITSDYQVAAMAAVASDGPAHFNGSYRGFSAGATTIYLASAHWAASGWYGMVTVQNLGTLPANVTLTINCSNNSSVGTLTKTGIPAYAAHTFVLKTTAPSWNIAPASCIGSAKVESTNGQPVAVVNNQNVPSTGSTNSIEGYPAGATTVFIPNLSTNNSGWNSALNIRKLGAGNTTVTIDYDDAEPDDTCNLTDAAPSCQLYMPTYHPTAGRFGAKLTSSNVAVTLITSVGGTQSRNSGAYVGVGPTDGSNIVAIPQVSKRFYNFVSAINCQNLTATPTTLNFQFSGAPIYNHPTTLNLGESLQLATTDPVLNGIIANGWTGGVTVTTANASAEIACTVGNTNVVPLNIGDWNNQYNAFPK